MIDFLLETPEPALADLEAVLPETIRALEHGLQEARAYFDKNPVRFDAAAFSILVRLHAREYLHKKSLDTSEIEIERVNLCGLWLKLGRYEIKIWKISPDDLQKGLESENRRIETQLLLMDGDEPIRAYGLAIYWSSDALRHLGDVYLVHQAYDDPRCFEWIWSRLLQHPADEAEDVARVAAGDVPTEPNEQIETETNVR
jgi:hypothetical protein